MKKRAARILVPFMILGLTACGKVDNEAVLDKASLVETESAGRLTVEKETETSQTVKGASTLGVAEKAGSDNKAPEAETTQKEETTTAHDLKEETETGTEPAADQETEETTVPAAGQEQEAATEQETTTESEAEQEPETTAENEAGQEVETVSEQSLVQVPETTTASATGQASETTTAQVSVQEPETTKATAQAQETETAAAEQSPESGDNTGIFATENGYLITSAGTYVFSGLVEGQILVDAGEDDEVIIELSGATITYGANSPIRILSAGKVEISAKKDTENVINDTRSTKTTDDDSQGEGAIYAKCDLKIKGNGTLLINASYNNGIHTTKDLTIQNLSLTVNAYNNAIKGNDSVTVKSGNVVAVSTNGDGVKTENTDVNKNGVTRGDITLCGGTVTVYAAGDGFQAAHNFEMTSGENGTGATVTVYTGSYSSYTAANATTTSYKGVKAQNELNINAGSITIKSYDDGLHADYGTAFDDGTKGQGKINISGGTVTINVYSPAVSTGGGRPGFGGFSGQQTVSGADGIHADNTLTISGGTVKIDSAYEGLEANHIVISGGMTYVSGNDDGLNASKKIGETPSIEVTGGYLDVTVPTNGDTDGIDSNGTYKQTGGVVIARGPNNQNMAAIDADGSVSITGGTLIVLGYGAVSTGGGVQTYSLSLHSAGSHTVMINGVSYTFTNASAYSKTTAYSDVSVSSLNGEDKI